MHIIYDGSQHCGIGACPIVVHDTDAKTVTIRDPKAPQDGTYTMSEQAWNNLLANAQLIKQ
jgi:hypothetical protein